MDQQIPHALDILLKQHVTNFLAPHKQSILDWYGEAHDRFLKILMPFWDAQMKVHEEIESYYYGSIGNRPVFNSSDMITTMISMLVPVTMRPQRFQEEDPLVKDQLARQHAYSILSELTGIPLPLILPVNFDQDGNPSEIFDLIVQGPDGSPVLTQWATPIIISLQGENTKLPYELTTLVHPMGLC